MLIEKSLRDLLTAFSSADPTPGGGSASALASAVGASLLLMVARLSKTRSGTDEERAALQAAAAGLDAIRDQLADAVDADASAYEQVVTAFNLPKREERDQQVRRAAIQEATIGATQVPLSVMRLSAAALTGAKTVALHGNRSAASDVGVAIALLRAGLHGAALNVHINLGSLKDRDLAQSFQAEAARLITEGGRAAAEAEGCLGGG